MDIILAKIDIWLFSYYGWVGLDSPPHWVLMQVWCGHNSSRRWWSDTELHSRWEAKEQPEEAWCSRINKHLTHFDALCPVKYTDNEITGYVLLFHVLIIFHRNNKIK